MADNPIPPRSVQLVVRLAENGVARVVKATELSGTVAVRSRAVGDFAYALSASNKVLVAESLTGDPFVRRSLGEGAEEHGSSRSSSATLILKVPNRSLDSLTNSPMVLSIYKVDPKLIGQHLAPADIPSLVAQRKATLRYRFDWDLNKQLQALVGWSR